jgi:hypothetical protein
LKRPVFVAGIVAVILATAGAGFHWVKRLPRIAEGPRGFEVLNCGGARDRHRARACPKLYCQKALLEAARPPAGTEFQFAGMREVSDRQERVIWGLFGSGSQPAAGSARYFRCLMKGDAVQAIDLRESKTALRALIEERIP